MIQDKTQVTERTGNVAVRSDNGQMSTVARRVVAPPADVLKRADRIVLALDVPGIDPASLDVSYAEETLRVRGSVRRPETEETGGVTYAEFELGDYERHFRLNERIDPDGISAELSEGVLTVELPLEKPAQTRIAVRTPRAS